MDTIDRNLHRIRAAVEKRLIVSASGDLPGEHEPQGEQDQSLFFPTGTTQPDAIERHDLIDLRDKAPNLLDTPNIGDRRFGVEPESSYAPILTDADAHATESDVWTLIKRRLGLGI
jgi:hypothetical protein